MVRETWLQSQVASYQRLKGVSPSLTLRCHSYWTGNVLVFLDYGRLQLRSPSTTVANFTTCREGKNFVFWFGTQFNLTFNFTQSGWLILFSPDLHFRSPNLVSCQTQLFSWRTPTSTDVTLAVLQKRCFLAGQCRPMQTSHCGSRIAAAAWTNEGTHLIYGFLTRNPSWI